MFDLLQLFDETRIQRLAGYLNVHLSLEVCRELDDLLLIIVLFFVIRGVWGKFQQEHQKRVMGAMGPGFNDYNSHESSRLFIHSKFQRTPPNDYVDPSQALYNDQSDDLISFCLKKVFVYKNPGDGLYCVLGGSGMGKTSFMVHVLKEYLKQRKNKRPFDISLISLEDENCFDSIDKIENKSTSILLLDALDENTEAVENYDHFIAELEQRISAFRIVVVSCRTQFFQNEDKELKESKLHNHGREKRFRAYTRFYLSPFDDHDVDKYLKKKYPIKFLRRRKAKRIIKRCGSLACRPLLLSYIDNLLESNPPEDQTLLSVYELLIDKWIDREVRLFPTIKSQELYQFSLKLAIAINEKRSKQNNGLFLTSDEVKDIWKEIVNTSNVSYPFVERSLINRNSQGEMKFSHKSFLEFFLAKESFENDDFNVYSEGMEVYDEIYSQLCHRAMKEAIDNEEIRIEETPTLNGSVKELIYQKKGAFKVRYLKALPEISILTIDAKYLDSLEKDIERSGIEYLRIERNRKGYILNAVTRMPNLKYVNISGDDCSVAFLKQAEKATISVIVNRELVIDHLTGDAPLDFKALQMKQVSPDYFYSFYKEFIHN